MSMRPAGCRFNVKRAVCSKKDKSDAAGKGFKFN